MVRLESTQYQKRKLMSLKPVLCGSVIINYCILLLRPLRSQLQQLPGIVYSYYCVIHLLRASSVRRPVTLLDGMLLVDE